MQIKGGLDLAKEFSYFKVDSRILELPKDTLIKSELLVYLMHCRADNQSKKKGAGVSKSAFKRAYNELGVKSKNAYDKAMEGLIAKGMLRYREEVNTGYLKAPAVEVLELPNKKNRSFIQIPKEIIDEGHLIGSKLQEIYAILHIYKNFDPLTYLGVSYEFIYTYNKDNPNGYEFIFKFGTGYRESIYGTEAFEVLKPTHYSKYEGYFEGDICEALNSLVNRGLISWQPILLEVDEEDQELTEVKCEIYRYLISNHLDKYILSKPKSNQKVIWIMWPKYAPDTPALQEYSTRRKEQTNKASKLYSYDIKTDKEAQIEALHSEALLDFIGTLSSSYRKDIDERTYEMLQELQYGPDREYLLEAIEGIKEEIEIEKHFIEKHNKEEEKITGKRVRKTTSPRLKQLYKELLDHENQLDKVNHLETQLKGMIPRWVYQKIYEESS